MKRIGIGIILLFSVSTARADFVTVSYLTNYFSDDACGGGKGSADFIEANSFLERSAQGANLQSNSAYYMGDTTCSWMGGARIFKIFKLYQGSAADVAAFVANPPTYNGRLMSFTFDVKPYKQLVSHYYVANYMNSERVNDILTRQVDDFVVNEKHFVGQVCRRSPNNLLAALAGTGKENEVAEYMKKYLDQWSLSYEGELIPENGPRLNINGSVWLCSRSKKLN